MPWVKNELLIGKFQDKSLNAYKPFSTRKVWGKKKTSKIYKITPRCHFLEFSPSISIIISFFCLFRFNASLKKSHGKDWRTGSASRFRDWKKLSNWLVTTGCLSFRCIFANVATTKAKSAQMFGPFAFPKKKIQHFKMILRRQCFFD